MMDLYAVVVALCLICNSINLSEGQAAQIQDVIEPAIVVLEPGPPVHTQGGKLTLTCVAYGEPEVPIIIWSAPSLNVTDFSDGSGDPSVTANIFTSTVNDTDLQLVFVISILELCDVDYTYSFVTDFTCEAINGNFNESTIASNVSDPIIIIPIVFEPASILAAPSNGQFVSNGPRISATCVVYGSPVPTLLWTQAGEEIMADNTTNIYTENVVDPDGDFLVISTLEMCEEVFLRGGGVTECSTWNGVEDELEERVQSVNFTIDPRNLIESFTVALEGDTAEFTFQMSAPITLDNTRCFLETLKLTNTFNTSSENYTEYQPVYPGFCPDVNESTNVVAYLDPRDFTLSLPFFMSAETLFLLPTPGRDLDFIPFMSLLPFTDPLQVGRLVLNMDPRLISFDVDRSRNRVLLHFTDYMDINTVRPEELTFVDPFDTNRTYSLTGGSVDPVNVDSDHVRTVCLSLSAEDSERLQFFSICSTVAESCACFFEGSLVSSFSGVPVQSIPSHVPFTVSKLQLAPSGSMLPHVQLQLSLTYEGCTTTHNFTQDEVYILRPRETITRMDCFSSGVWNNVNPTISFERYEGPLSLSSQPVIADSLVLNWPTQAYINFTSGFRPEYFGLFMCSTMNTSIQHYIYNMTHYLALPNGYSYSGRLYDNITIPFVLGSDPLINITRSLIFGITVYDTTQGRAAMIMPEIRRLTAYRGEIVYNLAPFSLAGDYTLRITVEGNLIASTDFSIAITTPSVRVIPSVVAVLPSDTSVTLQCVTNSPPLPVIWLSALDSTQPLSNQATYTFAVPSQGGFVDGQNFYCVIRDPEIADDSQTNIVASAATSTLNILDELVILNDGEAVEDFGQIKVSSQFRGNISLQCVGYYPSNVFGMEWISEEQGQEPVVLTEEDSDDYISVSYGVNSAYLFINNRIRSYRGTVRCRSVVADRKTTVVIADSDAAAVELCEDGDVDEVYGIQWDSTAVGTSDNKPCPAINGMETQGMAFRKCLEGSEWSSKVNVSNCQSPEFMDLREMADTTIFTVSDLLPANVLSSALSTLSDELTTLTTPGNFSLLPLDLQTSNYLIQNIIRRLPTDPVNTGVFSVTDNLLHMVNEDGWNDLNEFDEGSRQLLANIEDYGAYLLSAQPGRSTQLQGEFIILSAVDVRGSDMNVTFLNVSLDGGQITIPRDLLTQKQATGVVNILIENLNTFLPQPESDEANTMRVIGSVILSTQIFPADEDDFQGASIGLTYNTLSLRRAYDPKCVFWNEETGQWDDSGVTTDEVLALETGEFKTYNVKCSASHATAFAVVLDVSTEEFDFNVIVYVGVGVVIFCAVISIFALCFSCTIDRLRAHTVAQYFTHMSFCCSLICSFVGFLAGIELALDNVIGCTTTAAVLHYFFTAAFSWLFCESLLLVFYPFYSKHCSAFILLFLIGWTLPAIPTAISIGLLREDYTSSQYCWFFFDGGVESYVVLSFVVPKLALAAGTIITLMIGCTAIIVRSNKLPKGFSQTYIRMLWFMWFGVFLLLALLILAWIFIIFLVNVFGIHSVITGWLFFGSCVGLGIWLFIFILIIAVLNQKVNYHELWTGEPAVPRKSRNVTRRNREYEMRPRPSITATDQTLIHMGPQDYTEMENPLSDFDMEDRDLLGEEITEVVQESPAFAAAAVADEDSSSESEGAQEDLDDYEIMTPPEEETEEETKRDLAAALDDSSEVDDRTEELREEIKLNLADHDSDDYDYPLGEEEDENLINAEL